MPGDIERAPDEASKACDPQVNATACHSIDWMAAPLTVIV
jgi:hypothetical protein